jgi:O-antigen ligase
MRFKPRDGHPWAFLSFWFEISLMDLFTLIIAAAGLVWIAWFLLRGSLVAGCMAVIVGASCFGYLFWHSEGGPVPLSIDRCLVGLLAVAYVVHRGLGLTDPKPLRAVDWVLFALLGSITLSTFSHDWHDHNFQPATHLVLFWIMPAVVYWVARQSPIDDRSLHWVFGTLAVLGVYLTFIALAEATGQWWAVFPTYIASPTTEYFGRARGPFLNPTEMGIYLTVCLAAALTFWPRFGRVGRLFLLGMTTLSVVGIYATLTRSAWMGGALGLAVFVGLSMPHQWRRLLISTGAIATVAMLAASWDSIWNLKRDVHLDASAAVESAELRPIMAKVAWEMFKDRPIWGCGFDQYTREKMPYLADRSSDLPLEKAKPYVQHNSFLALLVETGLIGMGLFTLLLVLWSRDAWRLWADPAATSAVKQMGLMMLTLIAVYLPNAMFQDTNVIDGVTLLMLCTGGIVSGLAAGAQRKGVMHDSKSATEKAAPSIPLAV